MARPTKLTPERHNGIVQMVRAGSYAHIAAQANGIHPDSYHNWMARGRDATLNDDDEAVDPADRIYVEFFRAIKDAEAQAEMASIAQVRAAAQGSNGNAPVWQAAAWYLERKHADRWGRRDHLRSEVTGKDGGPVQVDAKKSLLALLAEKRDGPEDDGNVLDDPAGNESVARPNV